MKFRSFLGVARTMQQAYYKEGVELLYPDQSRPLKIAILPAYDPTSTDPTSWLPAIDAKDPKEESDFYTVVRAAKFVGHGNRRAKTSFLSPRTFDPSADDPYEAFYEYCSKSDKWEYLTKDKRGKRLTGEVEGAVIPHMKNFFVANVMDLSVGSRGGVFVTEMSETVMKTLLYSLRKDGKQVDGIVFQRDERGEFVYGDITNPSHALALEVSWGGKGYVVRPVEDNKGNLVHVEIPDTLLQHRKHMEEPGTFIVRPTSGQEIVNKLASMLRGYRSDGGSDEIDALKEAMDSTYGKGVYDVDGAVEGSVPVSDPFADAAEKTVEAKPEQKADAVDAAIERGVEQEQYTPVSDTPVRETKKSKPAKARKGEVKSPPVEAEPAPGEDIDPSDIAAVRAMLSGK